MGLAEDALLALLLARLETKRILRSISHGQSSAEGLRSTGHQLDLLITEQVGWGDREIIAEV